LGITVPEVLNTARGHRPRAMLKTKEFPIRFKDLGFQTAEMLQKKIKYDIFQ